MAATDGDMRSPLPTMGDALKARLAATAPVTPRRPWLTLTVVALAALSWMAVVAHWVHRQRPPTARPWPPLFDDAGWLVLALAWLVAFVLPLGAALLPPSGSVLPDAARARRWAGAAVAFALAAGALLGPFVARPYTGPALPALLGCLRFGLLVSVVPLLLGVLAVRRVALVGRGAFGAARGAAAGAVGALTLHGECSLGGALHVALGHGATVLVCALFGYAMGTLLSPRD